MAAVVSGVSTHIADPSGQGRLSRLESPHNGRRICRRRTLAAAGAGTRAWAPAPRLCPLPPLRPPPGSLVHSSRMRRCPGAQMALQEPCRNQRRSHASAGQAGGRAAQRSSAQRSSAQRSAIPVDAVYQRLGCCSTDRPPQCHSTPLSAWPRRVECALHSPHCRLAARLRGGGARVRGACSPWPHAVGSEHGHTQVPPSRKSAGQVRAPCCAGAGQARSMRGAPRAAPRRAARQRFARTQGARPAVAIAFLRVHTHVTRHTHAVRLPHRSQSRCMQPARHDAGLAQ